MGGITLVSLVYSLVTADLASASGARAIEPQRSRTRTLYFTATPLIQLLSCSAAFLILSELGERRTLRWGRGVGGMKWRGLRRDRYVGATPFSFTCRNFNCDRFDQAPNTKPSNI